MAAISGSCSNAIVTDKSWTRSISGFHDSALGNPQILFFSLESLGNARNLSLTSVRRKALPPVFSLSSSSPSSQVDFELEADEFQPEQAYQAKKVHVKFELQKDCSFGEHFYMVGSDPMFGLWDPEHAVPLTWSKGHIWTAELDMPVGRSISYKFILKGADGEVVWQPDPDRSFVAWDTENLITVCEDWENVEFQNIIETKIGAHEDQEHPGYQIVTEELPLSHQEPKHSTDLDMLITDEKLSALPLKDGNNSDENQGQAMNDKASQNKGSIGSNAKDVAVDNTHPPAPKKTSSFVVDYISKRVEESAARREKAPSGKRTSNTKNKSPAISEQNVIVPKTALGKNKKATTMAEKTGEDVSGSLTNHKGDPVLVPGLLPSEAMSSGRTIQEEDVSGSLIKNKGNSVLVPPPPPSGPVSRDVTFQEKDERPIKKKEEDERTNNTDAAPRNRKPGPPNTPKV